VNAIGRANLDGSGADPTFIIFAPGVAAPRAVAADVRGTATLTATVPGAGTMAVAGRRIRRRARRARHAGAVKLLIAPSRKALVKLKRHGTAKVRLRATYRPDGGNPSSKARTIKLRLLTN
jgi:hypothetical protein